MYLYTIYIYMYWRVSDVCTYVLCLYSPHCYPTGSLTILATCTVPYRTTRFAIYPTLRYTLERERNNKHRHLREGWRGTKNHIFLSSTGVGLLGHMPVRLEAGIRSIGQRETIIRPFFFSTALAFVRSNTLTFVLVDMSRSNYLVACPG